MKNGIFLIVLFLLAKPVLPVLDYMVNYDYISKVLCENKEKPQLHCNGKCHLMKELAKAADEQKQESDKKSAQQQAEVLFYQSLPETGFACFSLAATQTPNCFYSNLYTHIGYQSVFHPPTFIS